MSSYVIGIGGTGAKCVEALVHLCAAGMLPDTELFAMFVDPDRANGSLERSQMTLQQYSSCKKLDTGTTDLFKTGIVTSNPDVWSPFANEARPSLDDFFRYHSLKGQNPAAAHLFDVLYSRAERETSLEKGFRGHPSIGAAVLAERVELGDEEPWRTFRNRIAIDLNAAGGARVFLIGSIFGGTGAAGFPTIARMIANEFNSGEDKDPKKENAVKLGGALILPYFSFIPDENSRELRASSEDFLMSTQAALKYYYQQKSNEIYDTVYLIGDENLSPTKNFSVGSKSQRNEPHFIELYAALAAVNFLSGNGEKGFPMIARREARKIGWNDLPDGNEGNTIKKKLGHLLRFAFAYLAVYEPMLVDLRENGRPFRAPWYVDYFLRAGLQISDDEMQKAAGHVNNYCESFLRWLQDVSTSAKEQEIDLVKYKAFGKQFSLGEFGNLILPETEPDPRALTDVWERLCDKKVRDPRARDFGKFARALFESCE
jgi:hypothetical protein